MKKFIRCSLAFVFAACLLASPAAAQTVAVTSAIPNVAAQGTINLNIIIDGKGFKRGARAAFVVSGTTDPGGITVNSTTFVGSTQLVANIDVADTATLASFDVVVALADGRTGKGIELFSVVAKGQNVNSCVVQPVPAQLSLLGRLNSNIPTYQNHLGQEVRATEVTLGGRTVVVAAVGSLGVLHFFFLDPDTGQVLDGTAIGTMAVTQPHRTVEIVLKDGTTAGQARKMAAGDVNHDGIPDFIVGSLQPGGDASSPGAANLYVGYIAADGTLDYTRYPVVPPADILYAGYGFVALGDLDGDSNDDIAVGALGCCSGRKMIQGKVFLLHFDSLAGVSLFRTIDDPAPNTKSLNGFGKSIAVGDVTGDARNDLAVGALWANRAYIFDAANPSSYLAYSAASNVDHYGADVAVGDVDGPGANGGGQQDLLVTDGAFQGWVYSGLLNAAQNPNFTVQANSGYDSGWSTDLPQLADLNGDGAAELLIGASGAPCGGVQYLWISGPVGPLATKLMLNSPDAGAQGFGWAASFAPGTRLVFVTDNRIDINGVTGAGQVYVYKLN